MQYTVRFMPALANHNYERFAIAMAGGAKRADALKSAGLAPQGSNAHRLLKRPDVAGRIAELTGVPDQISAASPAATVASLQRLAAICAGLKTAASLREARVTLLEAHHLQAELAARLGPGGPRLPPPPELSAAEWVKKYIPQAYRDAEPAAAQALAWDRHVREVERGPI